MYRYETIEGLPLTELAECLNLAFSDYYLPIRLNEDALAGICKASGVDEKLSFAAFQGDQMVGVLLHSRGVYRGKNVMFDVAAGIVPEHRGKKVFTNLFSLAEQEARRQGVEACCLEVLQQNEKAIALYQKQGFSVCREFVVLQADASRCTVSASENVEFTDYEPLSFQKDVFCHCPLPSYEHSDAVIRQNPELYGLALVKRGEQAAFCLYTKADGSIVQMGYQNIEELEVILQNLLVHYGAVTAKNIDAEEQEVLKLLCRLGFKEVARQFEMEKQIGL